MAVNLGALAKKLLVKPIVSVGKAIGNDYKNTIYGADWREKSAMRRLLFDARLKKMEAEVTGDAETRAYTRALREAQAADLTEKTAARMRDRRALEVAAAKAGMTPEEYQAQLDASELSMKKSLNDARLSLMGSQGRAAEAGALGKEAWTELGLPSLVARNYAAADASRHSAERPLSTPSTGSKVKLPQDKYMLIDISLKNGDKKRLAQELSSVSRTQLVNSFGEDHPVVAAYDSLHPQ